MKNNKLIIVIPIVFTLVICIGFVGSVSAISGSGTSSNPYILSSTSDLELLSGNGYASYTGANKYFELGADIDFEGEDFVPIGNSSYPFVGHFDGKNHIISNMDIAVGSYHQGFFSQCGGACEIKNIKFKECYINNNQSGKYVGMLIGYMYQGNGASISNIETDGCSVVSSSNNVGGIAGNGANSSSGSVTYSGCYVHDGRVVSSSNIVGGIAGDGANSSSSYAITYSNCTVERTVVKSSSSYVVGGIAGGGANSSSNVTYSGCSVLSCVVWSSSIYVGGIAGHGADSSSVNYTNCVVDNVYIWSSSSIYVGGIAGHGANSSSTGNYSGCSVTNSTIRGSSAVGGIVGRAYGTVKISNPIIKNNCIISTGGTTTGGCVGQNS